jgi:hypothetical protein
VNVEEVLKPFQAASTKFMQANLLAQEAAVRQRAQTWLDLQDEVQNTVQEAYRATTAATRKHLGNLGQQVGGSLEETFAARARAQVDCERELRQISLETQTKLASLAQRAATTASAPDQGRQVSAAQQDSYQAYLADLQQAWSSTKALDPQTMNVIVSNILYTMSAMSQWG